MQIGELTLDNMLGIRVESEKPVSAYSLKTYDHGYPAYKVAHAGKDADHKVGDMVLLKPNTGSEINFNNERLVAFTNDDVLSTIKD